MGNDIFSLVVSGMGKYVVLVFAAALIMFGFGGMFGSLMRGASERQKAIEAGAAYYHPVSGDFTYRTNLAKMPAEIP
jgi:hypothetical protein